MYKDGTTFGYCDCRYLLDGCSYYSFKQNQEGYKRWRAGNYASENPYAKEKASGPLSQGLFSKRVRTTGARRFDDGAIRWCANLLATEESRLREVLDYIPRQYTCFHVRKRSGGFRYISAPAGDFRSMQQTIYHRIYC